MLSIIGGVKRALINIYQFLGIDKLLVVFSVGSFSKEMDDEIHKYLLRLNLHGTTDCEKIAKRLRKDIKSCYLKYLISPQEYFLYGFCANSDMVFRSQFLSDKYRVRLLLKVVGIEYFNKLSDKYHFYLNTSEYFRRGVMIVSSEGDRDDFIKFVNKQTSIFVKPLSGSWGKGCAVLDVSSKDNVESIFNQILEYGSTCIVEERIQQVDEMAKWNESSCNTVRVPAFIDSKGDFHILQPFLRTGRKGQVVDNAGGGGIFAVIDEQTGIIVSNGVDKEGNIYEYHPDSGRKYLGYQLPEWESLLRTTEELFRTCLSEYKYIGFDFALTDKGWVLIEGNWGQFVGQQCNGDGVKSRFNTYIS